MSEAIKFNLDKEILTIYLKGELNSSNAEDVDKRLGEILSQSTFNKLIFDFKELTYISSAGLRIILRTKQTCDDTSLVNVSKDVFNVFEMVGFTQIMKIQRP